MARPVVVPLAVSLLLHAAIIVLLVLNLSFVAPKVAPPPKILEARLVSMKQVIGTRPKPKPAERHHREPPPELHKRAPIKSEPSKPDAAQLRLERQKQLEREKTEAERKQREAERKARAEAERKKQQREERARQLRQQEKAELAKAMAAETEAVTAARDRAAVASYSALIQRDIENNWNRPPSARRDMRVTLMIQLIPSGDVINVSVVDSSGNAAFDRSAVDAVRRAGKFPYLQQLANKSPEVFDRNFRHLQLVFKPEDLRQ